MTNAQRIKKAIQPHHAPRGDGSDQIVGGFFLEARQRQQLFARQPEDIGWRRDQPGGGELFDAFAAQPFDIKGQPRHEMPQAFVALRRAGQPAGAARHHLAGFAHGMAAAHRAGVGKNKGQAARPCPRNHAQNLRDHISGALDPHPVADPHIEPGNLVGIVQRRIGDHDAAHRHRRQPRHRRQRAGAADLDIDGEQGGFGLFGGKLVRRRPARAARHLPQPCLPVEPFDLVDDTIDIEGQIGAPGFDAAGEVQRCLDIGARPAQRADIEAPVVDGGHHRGLGGAGHTAQFAPAMGDEGQGPRRCDARIELAQRAGGGVARVGELFVPGRCLTLVEREELRLAHIDLAAHFGDIGRASGQRQRQAGDMADIGGDILADRAIAARRAGHQLAVFIAQAGRQSVDLGFGEQRHRLIVRQPQEAPYPADEIACLVVRKDIVEAEHRPAVRHLAKAGGDRCTNPPARAVLAHQMREQRFDGGIAAHQRIELGIADRRRILGMVAPVVLGDLGGEQRQFGAGFGIGLGHCGHGSLIAPPATLREGGGLTGRGKLRQLP